MENVVVIGPDHYNTLWLVRSLGMAKISPFVIILSPNRKSFVVKSKYCRESVILPNEESLLTFLMNKEFPDKQVVLSSSDGVAMFLDYHFDTLKDKYIIQNCNNKQGELSYWMNKDKMVAKAAECGLIVPWSYSISLDVYHDLSKIKYPCLIKPEQSAVASKDNFRICHNIEELQIAIAEISNTCSKVLIQEYIQSEYEYLVYGVSTEDEICLPGGLHKIHTCADLNNMGMMSYACLSNDIPKQLGDFKKIKEFVRAIGYKGLFSVEFLITKDKAYFLEINLRNDGTCYITTQAGVNMPALWAYSCLGKNSSKLSRIFKRRYTYGMNEVNYFKYTFKFKYLIQCFKEILSVRAFSFIKKNDMKPVASKLLVCGFYIPISNYIYKIYRGGVICCKAITYAQTPHNSTEMEVAI